MQTSSNAVLADLQQRARDRFDSWSDLGYIKSCYRDDLVLLSYTKQAQAGWHWGPVERLCRGLILRMGTGEIVARPFDKFFNWGKEGTTDAKLIRVQEKMDGSLGIHYRHNGEHWIATRGSFDSPQAQWATAKLREHLQDCSVPESWTMLFEIIYPDNRIVVDYGGYETLSLLDIRDRYTGDYMDRVRCVECVMMGGFSWPKVFDPTSAEDLLAKLPELSANEEGFVGLFSDGTRWKFKGDEYRRMHRFATQLTPKAVAEAFRTGTLTEAWDCTPEHRQQEFANSLVSIVDTYVRDAQDLDTAMSEAPRDTRKDFALWFRENAPKVMPAAFARLDHKPVHKILCNLLGDV